MAMCILRGITTSYLRVDAAHGVAIDRCAMIFDYEFGKHPEVPSAAGADGQRASVSGAKVCFKLGSLCAHFHVHWFLSSTFATLCVCVVSHVNNPTK